MGRPCCRAGQAGPGCSAVVAGHAATRLWRGHSGGRAGATPPGRPWQGHAAEQTWRGQAAELTRQGHAAGQYDCFSLGASRVHWSVRQTCAEAFGCSVRRCGLLVVVSLEPTVRKLLSTSFLKTAWDRPGAAESESSVHAALRGVPQLRAPGTRRTAGLRMSRERPVSPPRRDCHGGCAPQRAQGRNVRHEANALTGNTGTAATATTTGTQRQRPATTRAAPKAANNPNHGGARSDHRDSTQSGQQHQPPADHHHQAAGPKRPAKHRQGTAAAPPRQRRRHPAGKCSNRHKLREAMKSRKSTCTTEGTTAGGYVELLSERLDGASTSCCHYNWCLAKQALMQAFVRQTLQLDHQQVARKARQ